MEAINADIKNVHDLMFLKESGNENEEESLNNFNRTFDNFYEKLVA